MIVVDGLRPDHLGCYGYPGFTSPTIDSLCASGVVFSHAYAQSSWAPASVASILTSRLPTDHGVRTGDDALHADAPTLATALEWAGYLTVAYVPDVGERRGFERGFNDFHTIPNLTAGTAEFDQASPVERVALPLVVWIEQHPRELQNDPLLFFVRYNGTQLAHIASPDYLRRFAYPPIDPWRLVDIRNRIHGFQLRLPEEEVRDLAPLYDASVAELDATLEAMLEPLRKPSIAERLWIILLAPCGEALGEHGLIGHGSTLYEEQIHVPLVIVPPRGHPSGFRYDPVVELIDVAPTVLGLAGLPPTPESKGRNLRPALERGFLQKSDAIAELLPPDPLRVHSRAVIAADLKKRIEKPDGTVERYDLAVDPGETRALTK